MAFLGTFLIGAVFLTSGAIKTFYSQPFIIHVQQFKLFSPKLGSLLAILFIQIECGLGIGLMMHVYPEYLVPFSISLLVLFTTLTIWGVKSKRVIDCGCFGNMIKLSVPQSLISNLLFATVLLLTWFYPVKGYYTDFWKTGVMIITIFLSSVLSKNSIQSPLLNFSYLKKGKSWNPDWLPELKNQITQECCLIVFLKTGCSVCKEWLPLLDQLHSRPEAPDIIGIVSGISETEKFDKAFQVKFPVYAIKPELFGKLVFQTPSVFLQSQGIIINGWFKNFPEEYL